MHQNSSAGNEEKKWTVQQREELVVGMINCRSPVQLNLLCHRLAQIHGRTPKSVRRQLWGIATRLVDYVPPKRGWVSLGGWTWGEEQLLRWAVKSCTEDPRRKMRPDPEYVARLLSRSVEEVRKKWERLELRRRALIQELS